MGLIVDAKKYINLNLYKFNDLSILRNIINSSVYINSNNGEKRYEENNY